MNYLHPAFYFTIQLTPGRNKTPPTEAKFSKPSFFFFFILLGLVITNESFHITSIFPLYPHSPVFSSKPICNLKFSGNLKFPGNLDDFLSSRILLTFPVVFYSAKSTVSFHSFKASAGPKKPPTS